jgi:hypothetical protein
LSIFHREKRGRFFFTDVSRERGAGVFGEHAPDKGGAKHCASQHHWPANDHRRQQAHEADEAQHPTHVVLETPSRLFSHCVLIEIRVSEDHLH